MTVLGLEDGKVVLVPHEEEWETIAEEMIGKIKAVMGEDILDIQHVGGTSIPCSWAKPIIDIMIRVRDYSVIDPYIPELQKLGIEYLGEMVPGQRLGIVRTPDGKGQTFHIHFADQNCEGWYEFLTIRDFCNNDPIGGKIYSDSKRRYSKGNEDARLNYREEKNNLYVVLRQAAHARQQRIDGMKTENTFLDDLFWTALTSLEKEPIVYSDGRTLRYKELTGLLVRAAVKLNIQNIERGTSLLLGTEDPANRIILLLGAMYYGCGVILTDREDTETVQQETGSPLILQDDFLEDVMSLREHLREADHREFDPAVQMIRSDGSILDVRFKEFSDLVQAEARRKESEVKINKDHGRDSTELITLLGCLLRGGVITID